MIFIGVFLLLISSIAFGETSPQQINFKQLESEHFVVRYPEDKSLVNYVYKIKEKAEEFYRIVNQEFNLPEERIWFGEKRVKIFIAKNRSQYLNQFQCSSWSPACVDYRQRVIYTFPDQNRFNSILLHELTHLIFRDYVGLKQIPIWLDEGIAMYMEYKYTADRPYRKQVIEDIKEMIERGSYIKFSEMTEKISFDGEDKMYIALFYKQAFAMVYFLIERFGRDNFHWFLYYLREGDNWWEALYKAYPLLHSKSEFERLWRDFYLS